MKLYTIRTFKSAILSQTVHQKGPDDTSGHARDEAWKRQVSRAKTWDAIVEAIYCVGSNWIAIAANDGHQA